MLPLPAQPRLRRQRLLHDRRGIDENLHLHTRRGAGDDELREVLQPALDDVVVIAMPRIDRDIAPIRLAQRRKRVALRRVTCAQRYDAADVGPKRARIAALLHPSRQPAHLAMLPGGKEIAQPGAGAGVEFSRREPHRIEAERHRLGANGPAQILGGRAHPRPR